MTFKVKIDQDMVAAAKAKDKIVLSALRMIKSVLHNREIDLKRELNEAEFVQVLSTMGKQRKDSIEQFARGGRADLVEKGRALHHFLHSGIPQGYRDNQDHRADILGYTLDKGL